MRKLTIVAIFIFLATSVFAQSEELDRFTVKGAAKLIATWTGKNMEDASGAMTSGDKIQIQFRQIAVQVIALHNNTGKPLVEISETDETEMQEIIMKIYEYDFDNDGQMEIVVIHSTEFLNTTVEVFKYSSGLSERVGNFDAQIDVVLDKNTIYFPIGSQGLGNEYLYIHDAFFELVYHNPYISK